MSREIQLDVCHYHSEGRDPFTDIMQAVKDLDRGDSLVLFNTFEPVPLYGVLGAQGYRHSTTVDAEGKWTIRFVKA